MKKEVVSGAPFLSTSRGFCHPWIRQSAKDRRVGEGAANIHVVELEKVCRLERSGDAHFEESDRGVTYSSDGGEGQDKIAIGKSK